MQGIGPVSEWEKQQEQFIPFNMKNYQTRLLDLLRRIQTFGVESYVFQKKPYMYTGSWMEYVRNLDDLMLQVNGVNPNEACMKIFNVLFPYPEPLPIGRGDESSLTGFFDGMTGVDKKKESRDCLPEQLLANINNKKQDVAEEVMEKNDIETVQDLLDIRQEVLQLRSANNALEFAIQQKDDLISQLRENKVSEQARKVENASLMSDEKQMMLKATNTKLQSQLESAQIKNSELEEQVAKLRVQLKSAGSGTRTNDLDQSAKLAEQVEIILNEKRKLQEKFDEINEKNKALRHKSGQVFLQSIHNGVGKKSQGGADNQVYLEDDEAIERMINEIDSQGRGGLKSRLMKVTFSDSGIMNAKQFTVLINDQLHLSANDQQKLQRVAGFANLKKD